jgi:hypothetical protein
MRPTKGSFKGSLPHVLPGNNDPREDFLDWLDHGECEARQVEVPFIIRQLAIDYLNSVPMENRKPYRWGWKNPQNMFDLEVFLSLYPRLMFIHVLRNPFDMASSTTHLNRRVGQYCSLNGGCESASLLFKSRCELLNQPLLSSSSSSSSSAQRKYIDGMKHCELSTHALTSLATCSHGKVLRTCYKEAGIEFEEPWRCLEMQLWAQINTAIHSYAGRCLRNEKRYLEWHSEDVFSLRGDENRQHLERNIAG